MRSQFSGHKNGHEAMPNVAFPRSQKGRKKGRIFRGEVITFDEFWQFGFGWILSVFKVFYRQSGLVPGWRNR